jgi:hypothetical protein
MYLAGTALSRIQEKQRRLNDDAPTTFVASRNLGKEG